MSFIAENSPGDVELIAACRQGSEHAFRQLFDKYWHDLYQIAIKRIASTEDVKDILQDVFLSLWNNIADVKVVDTLGGYLYVSLRNKILNYYSKQDSRFKALAHQQFVAVESEDIAWANLHVKEIQQFIANQVSRMPAQMKQVYLLSREEYLTNAEIAQLMGLAPQTVKNQLYRALQRIRENLNSPDSQLRFIIIVTSAYYYYHTLLLQGKYPG
ncbi:MAG: RNA polymerase sigma-70 factor [Chitinophagaceae bacterium]|nr:RNA polymerase sigma-70 factor [Chitinophagaceae bacterium]